MANLGGWRGTSIGQITRHSPSAPASGTYTYLFQDMTIDGWRIAVSRALVNKHVTPYDDWRLAHGRVTPRTRWQSLHHQQNIKKYLYCTYSYHSYKLKFRMISRKHRKSERAVHYAEGKAHGRESTAFFVQAVVHNPRTAVYVA